MGPRLKQFYLEKVVPTLVRDLQIKNVHQVPKLQKIVLNCGMGKAADKARVIESTFKQFSLITGQKPILTHAKKSIAGFDIRTKAPIGISITLRGDTMYAFLDRLMNLALPRVSDFRGLSMRSLDGHGNFNLGLKEQIMFPEMKYNLIDQERGMDIAIITNCATDVEALIFLRALGMPITH